MYNVCDKKTNHNIFLNIVQRIFCVVKKHVHHTHKKIIHHTYARKHHRLSYTHVVLLLLMFYLYNVITFNSADDVAMIQEETAIVIENEPQIVPDEIPAESTTGEILPKVE